VRFVFDVAESPTQRDVRRSTKRRLPAILLGCALFCLWIIPPVAGARTGVLPYVSSAVTTRSMSPAQLASLGNAALAGGLTPSSGGGLSGSLGGSGIPDGLPAGISGLTVAQVEQANASSTAYVGLSDSQAVASDDATEPSLLSVSSDPRPVLPSGARIGAYVGDHAAQVLMADGQRTLLDSLLPLTAKNASGEVAPVDLSLISSGGGFTPANGPVDVQIPEDLANGASLADGSLTLTPTDSSGAPLSGARGVASSVAVTYANTQTDTDTVIKPTAYGFDVLGVLRSPASPQQLYYRLSLPSGDTVAPDATAPNTIDIARNDNTVALVSAASAEDSQGTVIPLTLSLSGDTIEVALQEAAGTNYDYPITVDPSTDDFEVFESNTEGWGFTTSNGVFTQIADPTGLITCDCAGGTYYNTYGAAWTYYTQGDSYVYGDDAVVSQASGSGPVRVSLVVGNSTPSTGPEDEAQSVWQSGVFSGTNLHVCLGGGSDTGGCNASLGGGGLNGTSFAQVWDLANGTGTAEDQTTSSADVYITQPVGPTVSTCDVETGSSNWSDDPGDTGVTFCASDPGVGVQTYTLASPSDPGWSGVGTYQASGCAYQSLVQCPETADDIGAYAGGLPDGIETVNMSVADAVGLTSSPVASEQVYIDTTAPVISSAALSGETEVGSTQTIGDGPQTLSATVTDSGPSGAATSGVANVEAYVDGAPLKLTGGAVSCSLTTQCSVSPSYTINGEDYGQGQHTITIYAQDNAGNASPATTISFDVNHGAEASVGPGSVDLSSGAFSLGSTDVSIPGFGTTLSVDRAYDSRTGPAAGPLGPGWNLSVPAGQAGGDFSSLTPQSNGNVTVTDDSGEQYTFASVGNVFTSPPGMQTLTLTRGATATDAVAEYPTSGGASPAAITTGPDGNLWFTEQGTSKLGKLNPTTSYTDSSASNVAAAGQGAVQNAQPGPITSDPTHSFSAAFNGLSSITSKTTPVTSTNNWSLEAWIDPSSTNQTGMVIYDGDEGGTGGAANGYGFGVFGSNGNSTGDCLVGLYEGVTWINSGYCSFAASTWYHVVETNSAGVITFYVNGASVASGTEPTPVAPSGGMMIGGYNATLASYGGSTPRFFSGSIADAAFYSTVLTSGQVTTDYQAGHNSGSTQAAYATTVLAHSPAAFFQLTEPSNLSEVWLPSGSAPAGIASGGDGNLWVTEPGTNEIARINATASSSYADASGNNNTAASQAYVTNGASGPITGDSSHSLSVGLDGAAGYLTSQIASAGGTSGDAGVTWEAWIKPTSVTGTQDIYRKWDYGGYFRLQGNQLAAGIGNGGSSELSPGVSSGTVSAGVWSHVAVTYNASSGALTYYINGVSAGGGTIGAGQVGGNSFAPTVGAYWSGASAGEFFGGNIADVAMYPTALSQAQIQQDYNASTQSALASQVEGRNPLLFYQLNEPSYFTQWSAPGGPQGIVAGPNGNLWFTQYSGNEIGEITTAGAVTEPGSSLPSGAEPKGIAVASDGALWFTEYGIGKIGRITTSGSVTQYATPTSGSQPAAITPGPDGALWFTEAGAQNIGRISPNIVGAPTPTKYQDSGTASPAIAPAASGSIDNGQPGPMSGSGAVSFINGQGGSIWDPGSTRTPIPSTTTWSLEAWINPSSTNESGMVAYDGDEGGDGGSGNGYGFGEFSAGGNSGHCLEGLFEEVTWIDTGVCTLAPGTWYHIVETDNSGTVTFYLNGAQVWQGSEPTPYSPTGMMIGGYQDGDRHFYGSISNVAYYPSVLTASAVMDDYDAGHFGDATQGAYAQKVQAHDPSDYYELNDTSNIQEYPMPGYYSGTASGITAGGDGALWFANSTGNEVGRVTTTGSFSTATPTQGAPDLITAGPDGNVYFTDNGANEVGRVSTGSTYVLTDSAGDATTFSSTAGGAGSLSPTSLTQPGGLNHETVTYETVGGQSVPAYAVSTATGIAPQTCITTPVAGCRVLHFNYATTSTGSGTVACPGQGSDAPFLNQLDEVDFTAYDPQLARVTTTAVACYQYNSTGLLSDEWDPRTDTTVTPSGPVSGNGLQTQYTYQQSPSGTAGEGPGWLINSLSPPGETAQPWNFDFPGSTNNGGSGTSGSDGSPYATAGDTNPGSLQSVSRAPLTLGGNTPTSTVVYNVPLSAPYAMAQSSVNTWGETDSATPSTAYPGVANIPSVGTAIFPPDEVPSSPTSPADYNHATVYYLDSLGDEVNVASPPARVLEYPKSGAKPLGVTAGPDGNVWVTDDGTTPAIDQITPTGTITQFTSANGLNSASNPRGISTGPDGNLWFADNGTTPAIGKITPTGAITEYPTGVSGSAPSGIASSGGNLWFTDTGSTGAIGLINPTSHTISEYSTGLNPGSKPNAITASQSGNLWFTDNGTTPAVGDINPTSHTISEFWLPAGSHPSAITSGTNGNLWITESGTSQIARVSPSASTNYADASGNSSTAASTTFVTNGQPGPITNDQAHSLAVGFGGSAAIQPNVQTIGNTTGYTGVSLEAWIDPSATPSSEEMIAGKNAVLQLSVNPSDALRFLVGNGSSWADQCTAASHTVTPGQWQHVVGTYNGSTVYMYVNGQQLSMSCAATGGFGSRNSPLQVGAVGGSTATKFTGSIADVALYNQALTQTQITSHYNAGTGSSATQSGYSSAVLANTPVAFYQLNEPSYLTQYSVTAPGSTPTAITLGSDGNLWFTDNATTPAVGKITPSGVVSEYTIPTSASGPAGIATGPDGALWFAENSSAKIGRITTAGVTSQGWISTTQYDANYNVVSTLSPQNRLEALANSSPGPVTEAGLLETQNTYNASPIDGAPAGTELTQTLGPQHNVMITNSANSCPAGSTVPARDETDYTYDGGAPASGGPYYLATSEKDGAQVTTTEECDVRTTQSNYGGQAGLGWTLREPTSVVVDPTTTSPPYTGLNLTSTTFYDPTTAQPIETVQPADTNPSGPNLTTGASTDTSATQTYYFTTGASTTVPTQCQSQPAYAGLACQTGPAAQPSDAATPGHAASYPALPVTGPPSSGAMYNLWDEPLVTSQTITNTAGTTDTRTTTDTYDGAGRLLSSAVAATTGVGVSLPTVYDTYHADTGQAWAQASGTGTGAPTIIETYDGYGRLSTYEDANANTATYSYDVDGRVASVTDTGDSTENQAANSGKTTYNYDQYSGNLTSVTDPSGISFFGVYDADGALLAQTFPDAMTENETYDETGAPTSLNYLQFEDCAQASGCAPYSDQVASNIHNEWQTQASTLSSEAYTYDTAGRLTQAEQTPTGGDCTTRKYLFSLDSNRTSLTPIVSPTATCLTTGGTAQNYSYDTADRPNDSGTSYDSLGDVTRLPSTDTGGYHSLTASYYVNDYAQQIVQNGQTNTYTLDPANRVSERVETGTNSLNQLSFYDASSDDPAWTENVNSSGTPTGTWTRNITGIDGELDAIQTNTGTQLQLSNLHGDVIGSAPISATGTVTLSSCEVDEYGVPCSSGGTTARYSYLGAKERETELPSGIIAMGARVYNPYTGTFLQTDPIPGAGANAYGYTNGDPVNETDLSGRQGDYSPCVADGNCDRNGDPKGGLIPGFVSRNIGTIAEVAAGAGCVVASAGVCAGLLAVGFAADTAQNVASGHFSGAREALDVVGAIPGGEAAGLELLSDADRGGPLARAIGGAKSLAPVRRLGGAVALGAEGVKKAIGR
jgi:RHS repeat-associated protein